jgi:hypothetical protein
VLSSLQECTVIHGEIKNLAFSPKLLFDIHRQDAIGTGLKLSIEFRKAVSAPNQSPISSKRKNGAISSHEQRIAVIVKHYVVD